MFRRRKIDRMLLRALLSWCLLLICDAKSPPQGTSPIVERPRVRITATVGQQRLLLKCGAESADPPLINWKYNGVAIPIANPRIRKTSDDHLRIKNVRPEDAGTYTCVANNIYGQVEQEIKLVVNDFRGRLAISKPRFTKPAKMRRKRLTKPSNSMLKLRCAASGHPSPRIEWYKDGNLTRPAGRKSLWTYKIRKLQEKDSGVYMCRVWNSEGEINYTYEVRVVEQLSKKPVVLAPHPMNTTVQVGGMTSIQCRVQSMVRPTVKWIKKIEKHEMAAGSNGDSAGNLINIDGSHFLILPTQEMAVLPNGMYLNKLIIRGATEIHSGMYICLAANPMGYTFRYAFLSVVPGPLNASGTTSPRTVLLPSSDNQNAGSSSFLPAMIGIPAGIGLLLVILVACICQKRKNRPFQAASSAKAAMQRSKRLSAFGSSDTKSSTRSTPVPHDCDQSPGEDQWPADRALVADATGARPYRTPANYYVFNSHRLPPTVGTPLLTVEEPDDTDSKSPFSDDDMYCNAPVAPPCSEVTSPCSTEHKLAIHPPPPPSQKSASSVSSYPDIRSPYVHHYHYMHPPGNSRRHHHHHHSRRGHHHYAH